MNNEHTANSIFEQVKSFSYINEAVDHSSNPPVPPTNDSDVLMVKLSPRNVAGFKNKMLKPSVGALAVIPHPDSTAANTYFVVYDDKSDVNAIRNVIDTMVTDGTARTLTVDDAAKQLFDNYYGNALNKDVDELEKYMQAGTLERSDRLAATNMIDSLNRQYELWVKEVAKQTDATSKRSNTAKASGLNHRMRDLKSRIDSEMDTDYQAINKILQSIDYSDKSQSMFQLSIALKRINELKKSGALSDYYEKVYDNKVREIKKKINLPEAAFKDGIMDAMGADLAYIVTKFIHTQQKDIEEVTEQYGHIMASMSSQRNAMKPDDYDKIEKLLKESTEFKIAVFTGIKEHPDLVVDKGDNQSNPPGEITIENVDNIPAGVYTFKIQLHLGQSVKINDLPTYKNKKGSTGANDREQDILLRSAVARSTVALHNVMGYSPKSEAAFVVAAYSPAREFMGDAMQFTSKNTLGLLGAAIFGQAGKDFGEGTGKFLKYGLIQNPAELNPAIANGELWMRKRFNIFKAFDMENKTHGTTDQVKKSTAAFDGRVVEQATAAPAPVATVDGGTESPAAEPGAETMNNPGMINGMGDPIAPTKDKHGSGDDFNPKRKRKQLNEQVYDFNSFIERLYDDK